MRKQLCIVLGFIMLFCVITVHAETKTANFPTVRSSIRDYLKEGNLDIHLRSYYLNRHFNEPETQESLAIGGWLGYQTPRWRSLSAGAVLYTSQRLGFTDKDRDGASLLAPGQEGYTVLGEAYITAEYAQTQVKIYRQQIDSPFLNPYDFRMTPVTFEAYTVENSSLKYLKIYLSHVTKIKDWNDSSFKSMSYAAGYDGTDEPVTMGGLTFVPNQFLTVQLWEYYCHEFMNVVYLQADKTWCFDGTMTITGSLQAMDQRDIGSAIGGEFHTDFGGIQGVIDWQEWSFTLGFTITDNTHDTVNPWGSWPGYTSLMEEDNDLAGEKSWVIGVAYDFCKIGLKGLNAFVNHTESWLPDDGSFCSPVQRETNITVDYHFSGKLEGLWLRARYAKVDNSVDTQGENYDDVRVILNWEF